MTDGSRAAATTGEADWDTADSGESGGSEAIEVLVVGPFRRGGIHNYIEKQIEWLEGHVNLTVHDSRTPPMGAGLARVPKGVLLGLVGFLQFLRRTPPDVVHVHTSHRYSFYRKSLYVLAADRLWDVPVVLHVHGSSFDEFVRTDSPFVAGLQHRVFECSDEIVVLSEYWKEVLSQRADESTIRVVPNGVDPASFPADPSDDKAHIVFVSSLIERKGIIELAAAIEELSRRQPGAFRVSIAGDGALSGRIEDLADRHQEVRYLGYISEDRKRLLLGAGSIYVLPTHAENLPFALLEGMAGANAVVSTAVGAIPEVVGSDNGVLVEPGDVDGLVDALEELVTAEETRTRMAEANRRAVEERYTRRRIVEELLDIYERHV